MNRLQRPDCYQILEQTQQAPPVMKQLDLIPLKLLMAGPRRAERGFAEPKQYNFFFV